PFAQGLTYCLMRAERREEGELEHDSKARIWEPQVPRVADRDRGVRRGLARAGNPLGLDVDSIQPLRLGTRVDQLAQPPPIAAPRVQDVAVAGELRRCQAQQMGEDLAADRDVARVVCRPGTLFTPASPVSGVDARN